MGYLEKNPEVNRFDLASIFCKLRIVDAKLHSRTVIGCSQRIVLSARAALDLQRLLETSAWSFVDIDEV